MGLTVLINKAEEIPSRKAEEIPRRSARFSSSVENGRADAGRDGRSRLARPKSSAENGDRENTIFFFSCSADHEQDWQPYPVDPYSGTRDDHTWHGIRK